MTYGASRQDHWAILASVLFVASAALLSIDLQFEARFLFGSNLEIYSSLVCLLLFLSISAIAHRAIQVRGAPPAIRRNSQSWILLFLACAMTFWAYYRVQAKTFQNNFLASSIFMPGYIEEDFGSLGATDEGSRIPLYRLDSSDEVFNNFAATSGERYQPFASTSIHRENADRLANCHGWVFTEGRFLLKGIDVDRILCENHYFVVKEPAPGDIVIYRSINGKILHTALVQGILRDGTVITESKWGVDERFLHLPSDQPYSSIFEYYRTDRPSHVISIRDTLAFDHDDENG